MITPSGVAEINASIQLLATRLSSYMERPVYDQTGLTGSFDFGVEDLEGGRQRDVIVAILVSVQELGLKLKSAKKPVETIVIESAEKPQPN